MLGQKVKLPFFVSPAAMARLAHPDGELALARGCEGFGVAQCVCLRNFLAHGRTKRGGEWCADTYCRFLPMLRLP
jgi:hypothetical protein